MNYKVDDILYGFLVTLATYNPATKELYLPYKDVLTAKRTFANVARVDIRTVRNRVKRMIDGGYIVENEKGDYIFSADSKEWQLVEYNMLKYLVATRNDNCIKIYCYLLKKFLWKEDERGKNPDIDKYKFTKGEIARALGYSETSARDG